MVQHTDLCSLPAPMPTHPIRVPGRASVQPCRCPAALANFCWSRSPSGTLANACHWFPFNFQNADNYCLSLDVFFFALGFSFSSCETESFCDQTGTWTCSEPTNTAAANTATAALASHPDPAAHTCPCQVLEHLEVGQPAHGKGGCLPNACTHPL